MRKLTKHQRYYRKLKKDGSRDFRRIKRPDSLYDGVRVTRRQTTFRVSEGAAHRLSCLAEQAEITQWEMVSRIILKALPGIIMSGWAEHDPSDSVVRRYIWNSDFLNPDEKQIQYNETKDSKQLNMRITSTAWNKIHCASTAFKKSMSRILQELLLTYQPLTEEQKLKRKCTEKSNQNAVSQWVQHPNYRKEEKLLDVGDQIIHIKGIPIEYWDDEEMQEFHEKLLKTWERKLKNFTEKEGDHTSEIQFCERQIEAIKKELN